MRELLTTALEVVGLAAIVAGVAFIYWPVALIVAGVALVWISRQVTRA